MNRIILKIRANLMAHPTARSIALMVVIPALLLGGCGSSTAPPDAPPNHTSMKGGVPHAAGANNALTNCTECHGATLQGGADGQPSCFSCHGRKW